jgi:2-dehydro-3-deoxy-D-arabinonate dehydratase
MQLCKVEIAGTSRLGLLDGGNIRSVQSDLTLSDILHGPDPVSRIKELATAETVALAHAKLLPPVDRQEIWGAGVTYKRSREARERESAGAARFYDLVYTAERPELFLKTTARRVVGPNGPVRVRRDSRWTVPEPELALVVTPDLRIVGYTIGNDMSARDIEGENPLYLPQAKIYDGACALGPAITLVEDMPSWHSVGIHLQIERDGITAFAGSTSLTAMQRKPEELVAWLGRETTFPDGVILLTGTGVVPPDDFAIRAGDVMHIEIDGIGRLTNSAEQKPL